MKEPQVPTSEKALKLRRNVKKRKPSFTRPESWRYKRLGEGWRKPRGLDNKARKKTKGWPPTVNVGYRGPKIARGLHPSGYKEVRVYNAEELEKINPETQAARIAHVVGRRKRAKIFGEAKKKRIIILNLKETKEAAEKAEATEEAEKEEKTEEEEVAEAAEAVEEEKPKTRRKRKRRTEKQ